MCRTLIAPVAFASAIALTQIAVAADLPRKAASPPRPAVFSWTGCYAGANAGWAGSRSRYELAPSGNYLAATGATAPPNTAGSGDFPLGIASLTHAYDGNDSGGLVGAQVGCNYQVGAIVVGGEADWQWTSLKTSADASYAAHPDPGNTLFTIAPHTEHVSSKLEWFSTFRGRVGYAFDRVLAYATGGFAVADIKSDTNVSFATIGGTSVYNGAVHVGSDTTTRGGWVVGGGAEWAFAPQWSVKAEYLYLDFGSHQYSVPLVAAAVAFAPGYAWSTRVHERENVVRVGLNYKFY